MGNRRPIAVDLFSGAGGLSLGFEQAGFDVVAAVEYDPVHALVHRYNFPDCEVLCRDVRNIRGADVVAAAQRGARRLGVDSGDGYQIDAIIGGPSCQGFSVGGLRDKDDERNGLLAEFVRIVGEVKPRVFCLENVPGLLEPRFDEIRRSALKNLRTAGYAIAGGDDWLNAADYGVPQNRRRVFVVGILDAAAPSMPQALTTPKITVAQALDGLPKVEDYAALLASDEAPIRAADARRREAATSTYARELSGVARPKHFGHPRTWEPATLTCCRRTTHLPAVTDRFRATPQGTAESISRLYRLAAAGQATTLRAGTGRERGAHTAPRPIHPTLPRVITVREAARIHGYPDWFRLSGTQWHGHRQIGNSVPPPLARAVAAQLMSALGQIPVQPSGPVALGDASWCSAAPSHAASILSAVTEELPAQRRRIEHSE